MRSISGETNRNELVRGKGSLAGRPQTSTKAARAANVLQRAHLL